MNAPTPEHMRVVAEDNDVAATVTRGLTLVQRKSLASESAEALRAAADELHRLRTAAIAREEQLNRIASHPLLGSYSRNNPDRYGATIAAMKWVHEEFESTKREVDRLRAAFENAPHREKCRPEIACTCWKADAL